MARTSRFFVSFIAAFIMPVIMSDLANDRWFSPIDLLLAATTGLLWYASRGQLGWILLLVALVPWAIRLLAGKAPFRRTPLDGSIFLFLLTAVIASRLAYDPQLGAAKLRVLVGSILLFYALAGQSRRDVWWIFAAAGPAAAVISGYFLLSHNWQSWPADIGVINRLGYIIMAIRPRLPLPSLHPNVIAGLLVMLLPLVAAAALYARRNQRVLLFLLTAVCGAAALLGLLLTSALSAWLALAGGMAVWLIGAFSRRLNRRLGLPRQKVFLLLAAAALLAVTAVVGLFYYGALWQLLGVSSGQAAHERLALVGQSGLLFSDFRFTGSGLGTFPALYASYVRVTPFFFVAYSNYYTDVLLELGLPGLLALLLVMAGSLGCLWPVVMKPNREEQVVAAAALDAREEGAGPWRKFRASALKRPGLHLDLFRWAAFVSTLVVLLHGLTDDALFGAQGSPCLFLTAGLAVLVSRRKTTAVAPKALPIGRRPALAALAAVVLAAGLAYGSYRPLAAAWYANLGALAAARVELAGWPTQEWDDGRHADSLEPAAALFARALALDPQNRTALFGLGRAAMLSRDYDSAVAYLEKAFLFAPNHRGIVKLLGQSYVWQGQLDRAVPLLARLPETAVEMDAYARWWVEQGRHEVSFARGAADMAGRLRAMETASSAAAQP